MNHIYIDETNKTVYFRAMNDIKYLGVPLLAPPAGVLPSKGDTVKLLYGYNGGNLKGFQGLDSICCSVINLNHPHHYYHCCPGVPWLLWQEWMLEQGQQVFCIHPDHGVAFWRAATY